VDTSSLIKLLLIPILSGTDLVAHSVSIVDSFSLIKLQLIPILSGLTSLIKNNIFLAKPILRILLK